MTKKSRDLAILIDRSSLTFAGGNLERPSKLVLDPTIMSDLEIVDKKILKEKILSIIKKANLLTDLIIIFSDEATFTKEFPLNTTNEVLDKEQKTFLHNLPFDKVSSKLLKFTSKYLLVGINWDICEAVEESLKELGYKLLIVAPAVAIGGFDLSTIYSKKDQLKQFSLIQVVEDNSEFKNKPLMETKRNNLTLLVGIFIFLLIILAFMIAG